MASTISLSSPNRLAVVTGANKGIGFEICRQLASKGITVILTARDEKRGLDAIGNLKLCGINDVSFHQLDVTKSDSIALLAKFIETSFGKLDILVNKAEVGGAIVDWKSLTNFKVDSREVKLSKPGILKACTEESYEMAEECTEVNYHGTKRVTEALLPFLLLSNSGTIVNVSASIGRLQSISSEKVKEELNLLTKRRLDELVKEYLEDFKSNLLESKGWPTLFSAYIVSKAAVNAYTRIVAKEHQNLQVNSVCPGFVKTDINSFSGVLTVEDGAKGPVMLALLPNDGPTGLFFEKSEPSTF